MNNVVNLDQFRKKKQPPRTVRDLDSLNANIERIRNSLIKIQELCQELKRLKK